MKALKAKRAKKSKYKPDAEPSTTIFRKGSSSKDDLTLLSITSDASLDQLSHEKQQSIDSLGDFTEVCMELTSAVSVYHLSYMYLSSLRPRDLPRIKRWLFLISIQHKICLLPFYT